MRQSSATLCEVESALGPALLLRISISCAVLQVYAKCPESDPKSGASASSATFARRPARSRAHTRVICIVLCRASGARSRGSPRVRLSSCCGSDQQRLNGWRWHGFGQARWCIQSLGNIAEHPVCGIFGSRRLHVQLAHGPHHHGRQKKSVLNLKSSRVDQIGSHHRPRFPVMARLLQSRARRRPAVGGACREISDAHKDRSDRGLAKNCRPMPGADRSVPSIRCFAAGAVNDSKKHTDTAGTTARDGILRLIVESDLVILPVLHIARLAIHATSEFSDTSPSKGKVHTWNREQ